MKSLLCLFLCLCFVANVAGQSIPVEGQVARVWKDQQGREVRATLKGFEDKHTLLLTLADGRTVPFPVAKLGSNDVAFALEVFQKAEATHDSGAAIDWEKPKLSEASVIRGVKRENAPGYVSTNNGWEWQGKCIEARVQYKGDQAGVTGGVKAYFYNREGVLIDTFEKAPRRQDEDRKYIEAPESFDRGETVEVYFPITTFLEESDWATVLIVFAAGGEYSAETMPTTSFESLEFAEKAELFPDWNEAAGDRDAMANANADAEPEIRRLRQEVYKSSVNFNGNYQTGKLCMTAEVRAAGVVSPEDGTVKLYAFDGSGNLEATRSRPSSAKLNGTNSYVGRPRIADDRWYPVCFALDGDFEDKEFSTFVMVFEFGGKITAVVESSVNAELTSLEFPDKQRLLR